MLISADIGIQSQTSTESLDLLTPYMGSPTSDEGEESPPEINTPHPDWLDPIPSSNSIRNGRHTDVSKDPRYETRGLFAAAGDTQCTEAPRRIPEWVLSRGEILELYSAGHGTVPSLIYARGVPDSPQPDPSSFNKKFCTLIVIEIGFCRDLGCNTKLEAKTKKNSPLIADLKRY